MGKKVSKIGSSGNMPTNGEKLFLGKKHLGNCQKNVLKTKPTNESLINRKEPVHPKRSRSAKRDSGLLEISLLKTRWFPKSGNSTSGQRPIHYLVIRGIKPPTQ